MSCFEYAILQILHTPSVGNVGHLLVDANRIVTSHGLEPYSNEGIYLLLGIILKRQASQGTAIATIKTDVRCLSGGASCSSVLEAFDSQTTKKL